MGADTDQRDAKYRNAKPVKAPEPIKEEEENIFAESDEVEESEPDSVGRGFKLEDDGDAPEVPAKTRKRKAPMSLDDWRNAARHMQQARLTVFMLRSTLEKTCTGTQLAAVDAILDRMGLACHKLDTVCYSQHGRAGSGLFNPPSPGEEA